VLRVELGARKAVLKVDEDVGDTVTVTGLALDTDVMLFTDVTLLKAVVSTTRVVVSTGFDGGPSSTSADQTEWSGTVNALALLDDFMKQLTTWLGDALG
jgi:hypothetical protein